MISSYFMAGSKKNSKLSYFIQEFQPISTPPAHVCIEHDGFEPWISGASSEPQIFQLPSRHHKVYPGQRSLQEHEKNLEKIL